jgi:hypothetical protein
MEGSGVRDNHPGPWPAVPRLWLRVALEEVAMVWHLRPALKEPRAGDWRVLAAYTHGG